jgi:hypothetical protein
MIMRKLVIKLRRPRKEIKEMEIVRDKELLLKLKERRIFRDRIELINRDLARELVSLEYSKFGGFMYCFRDFSYFARVQRTLIVKGGMS